MKAVALLSGGLDSSLAVEIMLKQGIELTALKFTSPFCQCDQGGCCHAAVLATRLGIPLRIVAKDDEFLQVVKNPAHGYGSGMNPCIDCRIFMLKRAWAIAGEIGASFLVTGEVLGQRPMSQRLQAIRLIERESGLEGKIVRPLSARLFPESEAERKGWINRAKLLAISGRSRRPQIELARRIGMNDYPCPAGGCLLTMPDYAARLRDLLRHGTPLTGRQAQLLKLGRHFRYNECKVIVGRNECENRLMRSLRAEEETLFETEALPGPVALLQGEATSEAIGLAADLVASYSDACDGLVPIIVRSPGLCIELLQTQREREAFRSLRI